MLSSYFCRRSRHCPQNSSSVRLCKRKDLLKGRKETPQTPSSTKKVFWEANTEATLYQCCCCCIARRLLACSLFALRTYGWIRVQRQQVSASHACMYVSCVHIGTAFAQPFPLPLPARRGRGRRQFSLKSIASTLSSPWLSL